MFRKSTAVLAILAASTSIAFAASNKTQIQSVKIYLNSSNDIVLAAKAQNGDNWSTLSGSSLSVLTNGSSTVYLKLTSKPITNTYKCVLSNDSTYVEPNGTTTVQINNSISSNFEQIIVGGDHKHYSKAINIGGNTIPYCDPISQ